NFSDGRLERRAEPGQLDVDGIDTHESLRNAEIFGPEHEGRADGHSRGYGDSASDFHNSPSTPVPVDIGPLRDWAPASGGPVGWLVACEIPLEQGADGLEGQSGVGAAGLELE